MAQPLKGPPHLQRRIVFRSLIVLIVLVVVAAVAFFAAGPAIIEKSRNKIDPVALPEITAEAAQLHDTLQVVDMHSDTLMWDRDLLKRSDRGHVDLPRLQEGNVALQVFSSVTKSPKGQNVDGNDDDTDNITPLAIAQLQPPRTWTSMTERSLYHAQKLQTAVDDSDGELMFVKTKGDLEQLIDERVAGNKVTGAMFSVEGLHNLEGDISNVDRLYDAGMRMAGFAHFFDNDVAGSMHGIERGSLTDFGREVFTTLEQRGVIIDLTHSSHAAVATMLEMATNPVVLSHGGVQGTCDSNRNVTDDEIRGVAANGGVVGIGYFETAVCSLELDAVLDAIDHVVRVGGIQTAALGSDFDGSTTVGWDASQLAALTQGLMDRGYADEDIIAIMGGNTLRVMQQVLPD